MKFKCLMPECDVRVTIKGHFCAEHWQDRKGKAYYAPETPPYFCVIPECKIETPHREMMCNRHWELVNRKRQWQIINFSSLFHVLLGLAIEEVQKRDTLPKELNHDH